MTTLRVTGEVGKSHVNSIGAAIAGAITDDSDVRLRCMGANSVNTAIKGCIVAGNMLSNDKVRKEIAVTPSFMRKGNLTITILKCEVKDAAN